MYNYKNKVLLTGIVLLSLFVIVLKNDSFNNSQLSTFVGLLAVMYFLPMFVPMETFNNYKGNYDNRKYETNCQSDK